MGQKVNPIGFRLPVNRDWSSRWYASRQEFPKNIKADAEIRKYIKGKLKTGVVAKIIIERAWNSVRVTIHTARPGMVIGKRGSEIEKMTEDLSKLVDGKQVKIDIFEIKNADLDAQLVAENVATQLERRISFRRAMKRALQITMEAGALGVKIRCSGRLGGAEIARTEWYREGMIPLHTLRTPIDYGVAEAQTTAGKIGIKCWICRNTTMEAAQEEKSTTPPSRGRRERPDAVNTLRRPSRAKETSKEAPSVAAE